MATKPAHSLESGSNRLGNAEELKIASAFTVYLASATEILTRATKIM